jgi:myo-inositol-1(or 4)-monophosphatase
MEFTEVLTVALAAARDAAAIHKRYLGQVSLDAWARKGKADFVSYVDHEAEARIIDRIRSAFPAHEIMAEEAFTSSVEQEERRWSNQEWLWLVDPLDGTTNFLHGYPMYSASVAAAHRGEVVAAAVVSSSLNAEWCAALGGGATLNGERIRVSEIVQLEDALIGTGFPFKSIDKLPSYLGQFERIMLNTSGVRRAGSAAIDLCHVASGYFDGFWELDLYPWDFAAGSLLIREAGGVITGMNGELDLFSRGGVLAGNPRIHAAVGNLLSVTV